MSLMSYFGYGSSNATTQQQLVVDRPVQESTPVLSVEPCSSREDASYFQRSYNSLSEFGNHARSALGNAASASISLSQILGLTAVGYHAYTEVGGTLMGWNGISGVAAQFGSQWAPYATTALTAVLHAMVGNPATSLGCFIGAALLLNPEAVANLVTSSAEGVYHILGAGAELTASAAYFVGGVIDGSLTAADYLSNILSGGQSEGSGISHETEEGNLVGNLEDLGREYLAEGNFC